MVTELLSKLGEAFLLFVMRVQRVIKTVWTLVKFLLSIEVEEYSTGINVKTGRVNLFLKEKEVVLDYEGLLLLNPIYFGICTEEDDEEVEKFRELLAMPSGQVEMEDSEEEVDCAEEEEEEEEVDCAEEEEEEEEVDCTKEEEEVESEIEVFKVVV